MKVEAWKDKYGVLHEREEDQIRADAKYDLSEALKNDQSYYYSRLNIEDVNDLLEFLERHKELIKKVL